MEQMDIRRVVVQLEEVHREMERTVDPPSRKVTVAAVIRNPYAGRYVEDLEPLYDLGVEVGGYLARKGVDALGVEPSQIQSYGKGAIVGINGELEHAAAVLHPRLLANPCERPWKRGTTSSPQPKNWVVRARCW